jgi:hypothetical protein
MEEFKRFRLRKENKDRVKTVQELIKMVRPRARTKANWCVASLWLAP